MGAALQIALMHADALDLWQRLRTGDPEALEGIARQYGERMASVAFGIVGDRDIAADIVQEMLIRLWERRRDVDIQGSVSGYLYRAVHNRAVNLAEQQATRARLVHSFFEVSEADAIVHGADRALDERDVEVALNAALAALSPRLREAFVLSYASGLSYQEIAETLGVTIATVRQMMYRATQQLARRIDISRFRG